MKLLSPLSILRGVGYLLVFTLCMNCQKESDSTIPPKPPTGSGLDLAGDLPTPDAILSQTRTASLFNNNISYNNLWYQLGPQYVSTDDNSYAYSKKLSSQRGFLLLILQGFAFEIPTDAVIENIIVSARRFKTGKGLVRDYFATLITLDAIGNTRDPYGVRFTNPDYYPTTEAEVIYSQTGTGNTGGVSGTEFYQWMPAMINDPSFGVRIDNYAPVKGSAVIYYDIVSITVEYSVP